MTPERRAEIEEMADWSDVRDVRLRRTSSYPSHIIRELLAEIDRLSTKWCPVCMKRYYPLHRAEYDSTQPGDDE